MYVKIKVNSDLHVPRRFLKLGTHIVYMAVIPVFFLVFSLIFWPRDLVNLLEGTKFSYPTNILLLSCIILGCAVISRLIMYFFSKKDKMLWGIYLIWCVCEAAGISLFVALYISLMARTPYFETLSMCVKMVYFILLFIYVIMALLYVILDWEKTKVPADLGLEEGRMRLYDETQKLKLVISASSVLYIAAEENYVRVHYLDADKVKEYLLRNSMKHVEEACHRHGLVRCQRSYIVNPEHIKALRRDKEGMIVAEMDFDGIPPIPVSKTYYDNLSSLL